MNAGAADQALLGREGTVATLFSILGADVMAQHGDLEEVWDEGGEDPDPD